MPAATKATRAIDAVAVVALSESGEILAAREACGAIFGRDPAALVGQNICILLKDGLDNDVGRFLHRHRAGKNPTGTTAMRVLAVRKDGTEFLAQVTTLTWNWDTAITRKADVSRLCWTAAFRDLGAPPTPPARRTSDASRVDRGSGGTPEKAQKRAPDPAPPASAAPLPPPGAISTGDTVVAKPAPAPAPAQIVEAAAASPVHAEAGKGEGEAPRDEVKDGPTAAKVVALELRQQLEELEGQLRAANSELQKVKAESEQRGRGEFELRAQLEAAKEAAGYAAAALREEIARKEKAEERLQNLSNSLRLEQAERSKRFEAELINLRQERDELNGRLTMDQESAGEATRRAAELERRLSRNAAEFERARRELEQLTAERQQSESVWRQQLDTAWIAKKELEGAWAGAVEQNKIFEEELAKLRQEHDELNARLAAEQKTAEESKRRAKEVEGRLTRNAADSDRARGQLDRQNAERERVEAEWREQLDAAKTARAQLESALAEATGQSQRFEDELAALRREREELKSRLAVEEKAVAEAKARIEAAEGRAGRNAGEEDHRRMELEKQTAEQERVCAEIREQLEAAKALATKQETSLAEAVRRSQRLEAEAATLLGARAELEARLSSEQQATAEAMERVREFESRWHASAAEVDRFQSELAAHTAGHERDRLALHQQLEAAQASQAKAEASLAEITERHRTGAEELTAVHRERDELKLQLKTAQQSAGESERRADELQRRLDLNKAELERLHADLEKLGAERQQAESRWQEQQEAAKALARKLETDWAGAVERNVRLEEDLAEIRQNRDQEAVQLKAARQASEESTLRADDLDHRLERSVTELKRVNAEIEKLRAERHQADGAWLEQLEAGKALARKLEAAWTGAKDRARRFEGEVAHLRQEREGLNGRLITAQREAAKAQERIGDLEDQAGRTMAELERVKAEFGQLSAEHGQAENDWRAELTALRAEKVELEEILSGSAERNRRLESELAALRRDVSKPAGAHVAPEPKPVLTGSNPSASETAARLNHDIPELKPVQADLAKAAPLHPGPVQQYDFDVPRGEVRRSEARTSKRKRQP